MNGTVDNELPDLFRFRSGERVCTVSDWPRRRQELLDLILDIEYGHPPPVPARTEGELLHRTTSRRLLSARHFQYRLVTGPDRPFSFLLDLLIPGDGRFPVVLTGDACWHTMSDEIASAILRRRYILAQFNRVEIVPDHGRPDRVSGLYDVYPAGDYGALAAWAWGYHRCVDFLSTLDCVREGQIAAVGASRGGKAALLAGATDERIALTAPNGSGCCGAGCFRQQGHASETLQDMIRHAPYWLSPRLRDFVGREALLPFDQHAVKALIAPRGLLSTEALGDLYANPTGTWQTHLAAREVYRFLGAEKRIGISYRQGAHDHILADWQAFLDFADWQFRGRPSPRLFHACPFADLPRAFSWSAPSDG
jgi:hypothetical protein